MKKRLVILAVATVIPGIFILGYRAGKAVSQTFIRTRRELTANFSIRRTFFDPNRPGIIISPYAKNNFAIYEKLRKGFVAHSDEYLADLCQNRF
jgi:hypothetical protein